MTLRRLLWVVPTVLLVAAVAYTLWLAWQVQHELRGADASAHRLEDALRSDDLATRSSAQREFADYAAAASGHTSGVWWRGLTHVPIVGDDASGVQAMSAAVDLIARDAAIPLEQIVDGLDGVVGHGRIDLAKVQRLDGPVGQAHRAFAIADDGLSDHPSDGYVDLLRTRFDDFADLVHRLRSGLESAQTTVDVLPQMAGADGPRNYLLIFQNNAEVRATGGMPGSWALVHAEDGALSIARQGTAGDFDVASKPVVPLSQAEVAVYGKELGLYFQDPGFTPDFPRAAQIWRAHWRERFPSTHLDGVVALDPVGMSYLLAGTGPVTVGDVTLTAQTAEARLLNDPYLRFEDPADQDAFFALAARALFDAVTGSLRSPVDFIDGLGRAARERRLLVAPFDEQLRQRLSGAEVEGALARDDGQIPHVDVGLNDLTASKMSYYLRYHAEVKATACRDGVQQLTGVVALRQAIDPAEAASLPASVTGGGDLGTDPGSQYVMVRLYGPWGGSIERLRLDGRDLRQVDVVQLEGRPVASVDVLLSSRKDVLLSWQGTTGEHQTGAGELRMTPGVVPGDYAESFGSAC